MTQARRTGPALETMYRFLLWLVSAVEKFPRRQKFLLGGILDTIRETPINSSVSTIMEFVFPSLSPHTEAWSPQEGTPCDGAPSRFSRQPGMGLKSSCQLSESFEGNFGGIQNVLQCARFDDVLARDQLSCLLQDLPTESEWR